MVENKIIIDMKRTGLRLKWYAKALGYSARDIQMYLGLSCPQPIYRWYKGTILPSVDNLFRLSRLFHVHMDELLVERYEESQTLEIVSLYQTESKMIHRIREYFIRLAA